MGILSSKSRYYHEPFTINSTGCVGQTPFDRALAKNNVWLVA